MNQQISEKGQVNERLFTIARGQVNKRGEHLGDANEVIEKMFGTF